MSITRLLHSSMKPVLPVSIVIAPSRTSVARHSGEGPRRESMADCDLHRAPRKVKPDYTQRQFQPRGRSVQLTPREADKLLIYVAADLARRRRSRGLRLNLPEATALITEANRALRFDRLAAYGQRLAIPAGTAVRFEPGEARDVDLVPFGGARLVTGGHGLVDGPLDGPGARDRFAAALLAAGFQA